MQTKCSGCSSISGMGIGIWKNTASLIENLSDLAPESPLKFIKACQRVLLKKCDELKEVKKYMLQNMFPKA